MNFQLERNPNIFYALQDTNFKFEFNKILTEEFPQIVHCINNIVVTQQSYNNSNGSMKTWYDGLNKLFYYDISLPIETLALITTNYELFHDIVSHELFHCLDCFHFSQRNNYDEAFKYLIFDEWNNTDHYIKSLSTKLWSEYYAYRSAGHEHIEENDIYKSIKFLDIILDKYFSTINQNCNLSYVEKYPDFFNLYYPYLYNIFRTIGIHDRQSVLVLNSNLNDFDSNWLYKIQTILRKLYDSFYTIDEFNIFLHTYETIFLKIFTHNNLEFKCNRGVAYLAPILPIK